MTTRVLPCGNVSGASGCRISYTPSASFVTVRFVVFTESAASRDGVTRHSRRIVAQARAANRRGSQVPPRLRLQVRLQVRSQVFELPKNRSIILFSDGNMRRTSGVRVFQTRP